MDRHIWQRLATVVLTALVIFSIDTFSPVGNGDGLDITTIWAKKETHQPPNLLDQQIAILVGLDVNPNWAREQSIADSLICDIVKPDGMVPAGTNEDCSYLVTSSRDKEIPLFFKADKKKATIRYVSHDEELHTKAILLSRLAEQLYRIKKQCQRANKYASASQTGWLIGHRKSGL